jgi:hypothetical protein
MHVVYAALCALMGASMAWAGYRMLKPYERPPGVTGFAGPVSRHMLVLVAGYLLVVFGLVLAIIFGLIFLLT